jgi:hypothetical protein
MKETDNKAIKQMRRAITNYARPVMRCPPGRARAPAETAVVINASVEWLKENRDVRPIRDAKAARRKMRMARAQQQRIAKRNVALLGRVNKKDRTSEGPARFERHAVSAEAPSLVV